MIRRVILQRVNVRMNCINCSLETNLRWKCKTLNQRSTTRYKNLGKFVIKFLAVSATSAPSERIWSRAARVLTVKRNRMKEDVTAAMIYCRENNHILHKHYMEIAKERMHEGDYHFLWSTRLSCPHLKMKMMTTVYQTLMLDSRWIKRSEHYSSLFSDRWNLVRTIR